MDIQRFGGLREVAVLLEVLFQGVDEVGGIFVRQQAAQDLLLKGAELRAGLDLQEQPVYRQVGIEERLHLTEPAGHLERLACLAKGSSPAAELQERAVQFRSAAGYAGIPERPGG